MKSLLLSLLLLPLIAVIAVNGLYFPEIGNDHHELELRNGPNTTTSEPSGDCESNGGECKKNKKQCKGNIDTESTCIKNGVCCIAEVKAQGASELMLQILSNTILIQGMAIQTLKEDQENSITNLNKTMLSLKQTVEINNSNLSDAISNQGMALQSSQDNIMSNLSDISNQGMALQSNQDNIMSNLSNAISNLGMALQTNLSDAISNQGMALQINQKSIMSNLTGGFSNEENMLEGIEDSIMSDLSDGFSNQEDVLEIIEGNQDIILSNLTRLATKCPRGFFIVAYHCFKLYTDPRRSWTAAKSKCESEGLRMAEIDNPIPLMDTLVTTMGSTYYTWLGAKGDGSNVRWQSDNAIMPNGVSNYVAVYNAATDQCMMILSTSNNMARYRLKPFHSYTCTITCNTLCEYV